MIFNNLIASSMGFWNYLGLACLLDAVFGGRRRRNNDEYMRGYNAMHDAELSDRYDELSSRIDDLEKRLDNMNPGT